MNPSPLAACLSALALAAGLAAQCEQPQGNARLGLSGLRYIGSDMKLVLEGEVNAAFAMAVDLPQKSPIKLPFGTLCLGPQPIILNQGLILSQHGVQLPFRIPNDSTLKGAKVDFQAMTENQKKVISISNTSRLDVDGPSPVKTVFFDDFEAGQGNWTVTNGLWQIGVPGNKIGPSKTTSGRKCAGTGLLTKYPAYGADTILRSPIITLPPLASGEEFRMKCRVWFQTEDNQDYCTPVVSTDLGKTWKAIPGTPSMTGWSATWTQVSANLSSFASTTKKTNILFGFRFVSTTCYRCSHVDGAGFYLDDVHVFSAKPVFRNPEGFEKGIGDFWSVDNGLWQVGAPSVGCKPRTGSQCAALLLDGNYPSYGANTRLISAPIKLPATGIKPLYFWHCFQTELNQDYGYVQVTTDGGKTWKTVSSKYHGDSKGWTQDFVVLDDKTYGGKTVQFAFLFTSTTCYRCGHANGAGWFIDDIRM